MSRGKIVENNEKINLLKYNISRYDHYYASVNFKSSFLILANITMLGFIFTSNSVAGTFSTIVVTIFPILTVVFVLFAIKPYLKSYGGKDSIIFFGDVANQSNDEIKKKINELSEEKYITDLVKQNTILAVGLKQKFDMLNIATCFFIISLIIYFFKIIL